MIESFFGFIGHESVAETAYDHFKHGRNVIFTGAHGCGKTALMLASAKIMSERRVQSCPLVIEHCNPLKQFTLTIVEKLYRRKLLPREYLEKDFETLQKQLAREHYRVSVKLLLDAFRLYPGIFVGMDDIDALTPAGRSIVLELSNSGAILCAAATKKTLTLKRVLYQFQEINVPPLHDDVVRKIAGAFINERGLLVEDRNHFIENVTWKAAGNPLALDSILKYFENVPHIRTEDVRRVSHGAGRREVSIEWLVYVLFAFIITLRFVSRATMNKQLYIITSALVACFLILRYFMAKGGRAEA